MTQTLKDALRYVNEYRWSVIPIRADGSKAPALESWKEYQQRLPTEMELQNWFVAGVNQIGVVTGKISGLSVLDVDTRNITLPVTSSIRVKTPKGTHHYFKYSEGLGNAVRFIEHCDIRSEGGFCLLPPSRGYSFVNPYFKLSQLSAFPLDLLPKKAGVSRNEPGWVSEALRSIEQKEFRNINLLKVLGLFHRHGYSPDDMFEILAPHAQRAELTLDTLRERISDVTKYQNAPNDQEEDDISSFMEDIQPVQWLCKPLVARSMIGFVAGLPETQKTWLMMDLAIEMARPDGGMWLGKFPVIHGRVMYVDQERFKAETQRRFKALFDEKGLTTKDLSLNIRHQTNIKLNLDESYNAFRKRIDKTRPDLIIIDSFATLHTKDENSRMEIQAVLERIKSIRQDFDCSILLIDHENKSVFDPTDQSLPNAFKMVGSVGKPAAAEMVMTIRKTKEGCSTVYHTKSTLAPTIEAFSVKVTDMDKGIKVNVI